MNKTVSDSSDALSAEELCLHRHHRSILRDVSLALRRGELLSVLGANGAGKSTLLSSLSGEFDAITWESGSIRLNSRDLKQISSGDQAQQRAVLPQKPSLAFDLQVEDVVAMGAYPFAQLRHSAVQQLLHKAASLADITHLLERPYLELSGGEQQRVQFARVIVQALAAAEQSERAVYMLLDEPTASLDPLHQQALLRSVQHLSRDLGIGALIVLHDINLAAFWSDRIALLSNGCLLACDRPLRVLTRDTLKTVYGVEAHIMPHPRCPERLLVVF